jgi:hypothetical protein
MLLMMHRHRFAPPAMIDCLTQLNLMYVKMMRLRVSYCVSLAIRIAQCAYLVVTAQSRHLPAAQSTDQ